jgi:hypothetical protein
MRNTIWPALMALGCLFLGIGDRQAACAFFSAAVGLSLGRWIESRKKEAAR